MKRILIPFIFIFGLFFMTDGNKAYAEEKVIYEGTYLGDTVRIDFEDSYTVTRMLVEYTSVGYDRTKISYTSYSDSGNKPTRYLETGIGGFYVSPNVYSYTLNDEFVNRINLTALYEKSGVIKYTIYGDVSPDAVPPADISNFLYEFDEDLTLTLKYDFPADSDFSHLKIYKNGEVFKDNYKEKELIMKNIAPFQSNQFKIVSFDKSGNESSGFIQTVVAPDGPDTIAPENISNLKPTVQGNTISFSYFLPTDKDFSHLEIYRNNQLLFEKHNIATFKDTGLDYETEYSYIFKSVDKTGNVSEGKYISVTSGKELDLTAPGVPEGLKVNSANSGLYLSWFPNSEIDIAGYNVYLDGEKYNPSLVSGNSFNLVNLTNAVEYSVSVSAVDTSGNESQKTALKMGTPDSKGMPIIKIENNLKDVATSTENWFSELWFVAAFAIAIPLSFMIAMRVKSLFIA